MTDRVSEDGHEAMAKGAREHVGMARVTPRPLPLNSKRLTSVYVQTIARALELPTKGSVAETRQLIEGKLTHDDREPWNVQVVLQECEDGRELVSLIDANGCFLGPETVLDPREQASVGDRVESPEKDREDGTTDPGIVARLEEALAESRARNEELEAKVSSLSDELAREKRRMSDMWKINCSQVVAFDETLTAKDAELEQLTAKIAELNRRLLGSATEVDSTRAIHPPPVSGPIRTGAASLTVPPEVRVPPAPLRRGKAPPVSEFSGEDLECQLDDWLPSLQRASVWNAWAAEERMMQLAGHLKGRALQEWNLLRPEERESFEKAVEALRSRLDPGSKAVAAQDFRHTMQRDSEPVSDFVRRLERTFRIAYGRDEMSNETRDTLLYCQLQEGLRYELMKGPAVSGATKYQELCIAAKNEEKRLVELRRRQQYSKPAQLPPSRPRLPPFEYARTTATDSLRRPAAVNRPNSADLKKCFLCKKPGHLMRECRLRKFENAVTNRPTATKQVTVERKLEEEREFPNPYDLLYSSDSEGEEGVNQIRVTDEGSQSRLAHVNIQGVPADGVIDTGADITIMG